MENDFFKRPILNSPYEYPGRHWELDPQGQPTQRIIETRRRAEFITPIPKPRKRKAASQTEIVFDEGKGLSTEKQQYDPTSAVINEIRHSIDQWRAFPNPNDWKVTPGNPAPSAALAASQLRRRATVLLSNRGCGDGDLVHGSRAAAREGRKALPESSRRRE